MAGSKSRQEPFLESLQLKHPRFAVALCSPMPHPRGWFMTFCISRLAPCSLPDHYLGVGTAHRAHGLVLAPQGRGRRKGKNLNECRRTKNWDQSPVVKGKASGFPRGRYLGLGSLLRSDISLCSLSLSATRHLHTSIRAGLVMGRWPWAFVEHGKTRTRFQNMHAP